MARRPTPRPSPNPDVRAALAAQLAIRVERYKGREVTPGPPDLPGSVFVSPWGRLHAAVLAGEEVTVPGYMLSEFLPTRELRQGHVTVDGEGRITPAR